jgi:class 3 adenylate cyclase
MTASSRTRRVFSCPVTFAVVEEVIVAHRGHTLSWAGYGVVAEFPSVVEAIRCASEIQNEIVERNAAVPDNRRGNARPFPANITGPGRPRRDFRAEAGSERTRSLRACGA